MNPKEQIEKFREVYNGLREEIGKVIVGQEAIVDGTLNALFANGHVLLEGVPGLGKTLLVRTLSQVLDLSFNRIQFTPDLMPADVLGTNMVHETDDGKRAFEYQHGPLFAHLVLADAGRLPYGWGTFRDRHPNHRRLLGAGFESRRWCDVD